MTTAEARRATTRNKIAASKRQMNSAPTDQDGAAEQTRAERAAELVRQHPGYAIAGAAAVGIIAAALLPKGMLRKAAGRALTLATLAGEMGLTYGQQARETVADASHSGTEKLTALGETIGTRAARARKQTATAVNDASAEARKAGRSFVRRAAELAASARKH